MLPSSAKRSPVSANVVQVAPRSPALKDNSWVAAEAPFPGARKGPGEKEEFRLELAPRGSHGKSGGASPQLVPTFRKGKRRLLFYLGAGSRGSVWPQCLPSIFASLAAIAVGATVILVNGGDTADPFRCDFAAAAFAGSTVLCLIGVEIALCAIGKRRQQRPGEQAAWVSALQIFFEVNAVGVVALALLGHATWALVQVFAVLAAMSWTVVCCSSCACAWRRGIPSSADGESNLMAALLNAPKYKALACWVVFVAMGYGAMYFKSLEQAGLSAGIGRMEHFMLFAFGGLFISSGLCWLGLCALPAGRHLLQAKGDKDANLSMWQVVWRALWLSLGAHFVTGAFIAFAFTGVVTFITILLAQLAVRGSRMQKRKQDAAEQSPSGARDPKRSHRSSRDDPQSRPRGAIKKKKARERAQALCAVVLVLLIGFARVAVLVSVFLFDVTFVQSYFVGTRRQSFALAGEGLACGIKGALAADHVEDRAACLEKVANQASAFLFGVSENVTGECYPQTLEVSIDAYMAFRAGQPQGGTNCPHSSGTWQDVPGFDFFVLAPTCGRFRRRRLEEISSSKASEDSTTISAFDMPFRVGEAVGTAFGVWSQRAVDWYTGTLRLVMDVEHLGIPKEVDLRCTGIRRFISACMVLGAVMTVAGVSSIDLLSIIAASTEVTKAYAARTETFLEYGMMLSRALVLKQLVLLLLQLTISAGAKMVWEASGIFWQHCGFLIDETHLGGTACPNVWHAPVDVLAMVLLFVGCLLAIFTFVAVMSGSLYGLASARWAVQAFFGHYLKLPLVRTGISGRSETPEFNRNWCNRLLRPFLGLGVSFGIWTTSGCRNYQCGPRQDWYEPVTSADEDAAGKPHLVDFRAVYEATAQNISLIWLPVPFVGAVMSKGALYLNASVIFACGQDGGGTSRKPQQMIMHFQEDTPRIVHILNWVSNAALFLMILAINVDFFGVPAEARLHVLTGCILVVLVFAILHVTVDLVKELRFFRRGKSLLRSCSWVVEDNSVYKEGVIAQLARCSRGETGSDPLGDLPSCERNHRKRVLNACEELLELPWVREQRLPKDAKSRLLSTANRRSRINRVLNRLLKSEEAQPGSPEEAVLLAGTILYIHEAAGPEIRALRALQAARRRALHVVHEAAKVVGQELEQQATTEARTQVARLAMSRVSKFEEAKQLHAAQSRLRPADGKAMPEPVEPERWLSLEFEAASTGVTRVTAYSLEEHSGTELVEPQEAMVTVIVSGKVELTWPTGKDCNAFSLADVQVKAVRHQIKVSSNLEWASPVQEDALDANSPRGARAEDPAPQSEVALDGKDWLCGLCVNEDATQRCQCCLGQVRRLSERHGSCGTNQTWYLADLGITWTAAKVANDTSVSGLPGGDTREPAEEGLPARILGTEGGAASSSFRVTKLSPRPRRHAMSASKGPARPAQDAIEALEAALRESVNNPRTLTLAAAFLSALSSDRHHMGAEQADKCSRLMAVASKILRVQQRRQGPTTPSSQSPQLMVSASMIEEAIDLEEPVRPATPHIFAVESGPLDTRISALEGLREALARDDLNSDELSMAIDKARRADVEPLILAKAEEKFRMLIRKQRAFFALVRAMESRMIHPLRQAIKEARLAGIEATEYPDKRTGCGVLQKAQSVLQEEEANVLTALKEAINRGGALQLQRALEQVKALGIEGAAASDPTTLVEEIRALMAEAQAKLTATGEKKRLIALLKMALKSGNAGLLKAAVKECERDGSNHGIDLRLAKKRLETLQNVTSRLKDLLPDTTADIDIDCLLSSSTEERPTTPVSRSSRGPSITDRNVANHSGTRPMRRLSMDQVRASAALRTALFQEPMEAQMLRLAIHQAKEVELDGPDLKRAEAALIGLVDQERALEELRKAAAVRDVSDLSVAISNCHEIGLDRKKLLMAFNQLMDEQAKVARIAGDHGLNSAVLADLERERRRLHNSIVESLGGLRVVCRIRQQVPSDPKPTDRSTSAPVLERTDRHTLSVLVDGAPPKPVRFSAVFDADCIQAELFSDLHSLAQSVVDGYNILLMAGGPRSGGKTFSMLGNGVERRGVIPRMIEEVFMIRERDSWRANLEVDAQFVEVYDARRMADVLSRGAGRSGILPSVRLVQTGRVSPDLQREAQEPNLVIVEGAVTRRAASKQELIRMVRDGYQGAPPGGRPRHMVLLVTLTRTNRATGTMVRSKLAFADLASSGSGATPEVTASYRALEAVFKALARQQRRPPFRDHVLTQLLQDCMGGSAKTVLLLAMPPAVNATYADCMDAIAFATSASW